MKKEILFVANTFYQLIIAIQLKNTTFAYDNVNLILSDHSVNSKEIYDKLCKNNIFDKVIFFESANIDKKKNFLSKLNECISIIFNLNNVYCDILKKNNITIIDELIFLNYRFEIDGFFSYLYNFNHNITMSLMEEGIFSYNGKMLNYKRAKLVGLIRNLFFKRKTRDNLKNFYCFYPNIYLGNLNVCTIPKITLNSKTSNELNIIFKSNNDLNLDNKYVFFTTIIDEGYTDIFGEVKLVEKVASIVGKDNLIIKKHPRDSTDIYENLGYNIFKNSGLPWEYLILCGYIKNCKLLTVYSTAPFSGNLLLDNPMKSYYLYKVCDHNNDKEILNFNENMSNVLLNINDKNAIDSVKIINDINEILN